MTFVPDRRPIKKLHVYNGAVDHPRGIRVSMRTLDGFLTTLFAELDAGYAKGFRRFMVHAPAGRPRSVAQVKAGFGLYHHHHLPDDVKGSLKRDLSGWLFAHRDAVVSVYLGFAVNEGGRYHVTVADRWAPDPRIASDRAAFLLEVEQWLAISPEPGQIGLGFDASRDAPELLALWAEEMRARGVWIMGEAIPEVQQQAAPQVYRAPWWASKGFYSAVNTPWRQAWQWDPTVTEMIVGFAQGELTSVDDARTWTSRGYVLASWHDTMDDYVLGA